MKQNHSFNASNQNHLYERKYLGNGRYYQRGVCKGISVGDEFTCFTEPNSTLIVDKILSIGNSKGKYENEQDAIDSLYEAELVHPMFESAGINYKPLKTI